MAYFDYAYGKFKSNERIVDYEYEPIESVMTTLEIKTMAPWFSVYEYKGQVKNGKAHGYGVKSFKSGTLQSGFYRNGCLDGFVIQGGGDKWIRSISCLGLFHQRFLLTNGPLV